MSPDTWVSVLLTSVTIILGAVAIILAVAAVVGYSAIKESAISAAKDEIRKFVTTEGISEGIKDQIRALVEDEIELARTAQGLAAAFPTDVQGEEKGTERPLVEYPKDGDQGARNAAK